MPVKVHIHITHRQFTNGLDVVPAEGNTVGECLNYLIRQYPEWRKRCLRRKISS